MDHRHPSCVTKHAGAVLGSQHDEQFSTHPDLESIVVPEQSYAVVTHLGPTSTLPQTLKWVLNVWLPQSGYIGKEGFEIERYPRDYDVYSPHAHMDFWLPIEKLP